jgi:hypothetical protein
VLGQGVVRAQYGDWQMSCDTPPGASFEQCAIIQNVMAEDQPNVGLSRRARSQRRRSDQPLTMLNFERASLTQKLTSMCLLATASALLVAYLAFAWTQVADHRRAESMELTALAKVAAANNRLKPVLLACDQSLLRLGCTLRLCRSTSV